MHVDQRRSAGNAVDYQELFCALPTAYLVMSPNLVIVDANEHYLALLGRTRDELVGRYVFDVFPPTPETLDADGRNPLQQSFERARDSGRPDQLPLFNYDVLDPSTGLVQQRYWSLISAPVLGDDGRSVLILQRVEDVTDYVEERRQRQEGVSAEHHQRRIEVFEADLYARSQELRAALDAEARATQRLAGMAEAALLLSGADSLEQLAEVVAGAGLAALGAQGGAICLVGDDGMIRFAASSSLSKGTQTEFAVMPADSDAPGAWVIRTGQPLLLPTRAAGAAWSSIMPAVYEASGCSAWATVPLRVGERVLGSMAAGWVEERDFPADEVDLLTVFAAQCAQALDRLLARNLERRETAEIRQLSEALQRSLLTDPPRLDRLQVAVRYLPASSGAHVGGDWYDAFSSSGGATTLVVGDVTGHDLTAVAAMGQIRNLLRGVAHMVDSSPSKVLSALDRTLTSLHVDTLATATLAHVHSVDERSAAFTWSSAGHPPPLLVDAAGQASFLDAEADLLLGLDPATERSDHRVVLAAGASILLYTDGLIERRGESLDVGLERLRATAAELATLPIDGFCDQLLVRLADLHLDDIALLAVRLEGDHG